MMGMQGFELDCIWMDVSMCKCTCTGVSVVSARIGRAGQQQRAIDHRCGCVCGARPITQSNPHAPNHCTDGSEGTVPLCVPALRLLPPSRPCRTPFVPPHTTVLIHQTQEPKTHRKSSMRSARAWTSVLDTMVAAVELNGRAVACLFVCCEVGWEWVFPSVSGGPWKESSRVIDEAGID